MSDILYIPCYSLTPSNLTIYEIPDLTFFSDKQKKTFENLKDNENKYFELSEHSRKRLKKSIDFLLYISQNKSITGSRLKSKKLSTEIEIEHGKAWNKPVNYKLTFITLTLSAKQHNSDEEIKSGLLNHFLTYARQSWEMQYYIWKAEKQQNGNIHFHILTNLFIPHAKIRTAWDKIQNKTGFSYVDTYSQNMQEYFKSGFRLFPDDKRTETIQRKAYEKNKQINWTNPNSTDIHSLYKVRDVAAYMTKYLAKSVTKTDRVIEMTQLYDELEKLQAQKSENNIKLLFEPEYDTTQEEIATRITILQEKLNILKEQGVSGRIWGQSQNLSKLKTYSDIQHWESIPDISIVQKTAEYKSSFQTGQRTINTFKFDINNTPTLKSILDKHIETCLSKEAPTFFD